MRELGSHQRRMPLEGQLRGELPAFRKDTFGAAVVIKQNWVYYGFGQLLPAEELPNHSRISFLELPWTAAITESCPAFSTRMRRL